MHSPFFDVFGSLNPSVFAFKRESGKAPSSPRCQCFQRGYASQLCAHPQENQLTLKLLGFEWTNMYIPMVICYIANWISPCYCLKLANFRLGHFFNCHVQLPAGDQWDSYETLQIDRCKNTRIAMGETSVNKLMHMVNTSKYL